MDASEASKENLMLTCKACLAPHLGVLGLRSSLGWDTACQVGYLTCRASGHLTNSKTK
jgi:hypothetical protein